jgi:hypothetical protein
VVNYILYGVYAGINGTTYDEKEHFSGCSILGYIAHSRAFAVNQLGSVISFAGLALAVALLPLAISGAQATVGPVASLVLTPQDSTNFTGEEHTVTATVLFNGSPASEVVVEFEVTGAHSESGSDTTDDNGQATFTYTGTNIGDDTITSSASFLVPDGEQQFFQVNVRDTAQKHWSMFVIPESPVGVIAMISASLAAAAGFMFWKNRSRGIRL